jgi:PAS domain S-box-containing protein
MKRRLHRFVHPAVKEGCLSCLEPELPQTKTGDLRPGPSAAWPDSSPNPVAEADLFGHLTYCNPAGQSIFPSLLSRGILHPWLAGLGPILDGFREGQTAMVQREMETGGFWWLQSIQYVPGQKRARIIGMNITEHKHLEQTIRRAKRDWEQTFDSVPDLIAVVDGSNRITRVNRALADRLGLTPQQCIGKQCHELLHTPCLPLEACRHTQTFIEGKEYREEVYQPRLGGRFFVSITPLFAKDGRVTGTVQVARAITQSAAAEAALRESRDHLAEITGSRKTGQRDRLQGEQLSLVGDELGGILVSLTVAADILRMSDASPAVGSRHNAYQALTRTLEHLKGSSENFSCLSRLESGDLAAPLRPLDIRGAVRQALQTLRPTAESKKILLSLDCVVPEGSPLSVRASPAAVGIILGNLIGNAIKFTPNLGAVTVHIRHEEGPQPRVVVCVQDTGIGIAQEDQKQVLEGFFRTEESRRIARGFGVGLRLINGLLEQQGSRLELESEPGKGSTFRFRLPLWDREAVPS